MGPPLSVSPPPQSAPQAEQPKIIRSISKSAPTILPPRDRHPDPGYPFPLDQYSPQPGVITMETSATGMEQLAITDIRTILYEDFSQNKIDRIIMAVKPADPTQNLVALEDIRPILEQDFSLTTVNRIMMTLKLSCCVATDS